MIEKLLLLCVFCVPGLQGSSKDFLYSDKALGWLKYYKTQQTWIDAKCICDSDGAVLASPLVANLRDEIKRLVFQEDPSPSAIYTGVQAAFDTGNFFSIEGVAISDLPVPLYQGQPIVYDTQESCVNWDLVNNRLMKVRCDTRQPYVCYKKRTDVILPTSVPETKTMAPEGPPEIETTSESKPDSPTEQHYDDISLCPSEIYLDVKLEQPYQPTQTDQGSPGNQGPQSHQWMQGNQGLPINQYSQTNQGSPINQYSQTNPRQQPNQRSQTNQVPLNSQRKLGAPTNLHQQTKQESTINQRSQMNQGSQTNQPPQINQWTHTQQQQQIKNQGSPTNQWPQTNHANKQEKRIPKCTVDGQMLVVINSQLELTAMKHFKDSDLPVTVIFTDLANIKNITTAPWRVVVQNYHIVGSAHKPYTNETLTKGSNLPSNGNAESGTQRNPDLSGGNSPVSTYGKQLHRPVHISVTQKYPVVGGKTHYATVRTVPPTYAPRSFVQYDSPTAMQTPYQPYLSYPVKNYGYVFKKQAEGWLKMHQPATWEEAKNRCASEGAVIASPLTANLLNAIKVYVSEFAGSVTRLYSGVHASFANGDFYSIEGVSLSAMPVHLAEVGVIDYQSSHTCIVMNTQSDMVSSTRCTDLLPFVCHKKRTVVIGCDKTFPGYSYEPRTGSCYMFNKEPKTWLDAYNKCIKENGYLAVINSLAEKNALMDLFQQYPQQTLSAYYKNNIYIGLRDWGNGWQTVKGQTLQDAGFIGWARTEPNNAGGKENCGTMHRSGFLYDDPCELRLSFICEKNSTVYDNKNIVKT